MTHLIRVFVRLCAPFAAATLAFLAQGAIGADAELLNGHFFDEPTSNYEDMSAKLRECGAVECEGRLRPSTENVRMIVREVDRLNAQVAELAMLVISQLDGGELEDLLRSLGSYADQRPQLFLRMIASTNVSDRYFELILRTAPECAIDDEEARSRARRTRVAAIQGVSDSDLAPIRARALSHLSP